MQNRVVVVACALLSGTASVAFAGEPAWCKGENFDEAASNLSARTFQDDDPVSIVRNVVSYSCSKDPGIDAQRPMVEKVRAEWSKKLFMNDADWSDAVLYVKNSGFSGFDIPVSAKTIATLTPIDQYLSIKQGFGGDSGNAVADSIYAADAMDDVLTETGRLGFLESCGADKGVGRDDYEVMMWAVCQADVAKLDGNKLAAELRTDTAHTPQVRTAIHIRIAVVLDSLQKAKDQAAKLVKRDDVYKKVFDVAAKGRADWATTLGTNKELLALVQAMDSAVAFHSRKQLAGCEEKTAKALATAVSTIPAKAFTGMYDIRDDPFGGFAHKAAPVLVNTPVVNLAATAYALCQPKSAIGDMFGAYLQEVPGFRGPRSAAFAAVFAQKFELDDTNLKEVPVPKIGQRPYDRSGGSISSAGGVVKSVKPGTGEDKGKMVVALQPTKIKQTDCVKEHSTNRITGITSGGTVQYELVCDKTAVVEHDNTWTDFKISPSTAAWLKPGVVFSSVHGEETADVVAVWPNKSAKLPSLVLGGTVK